MQNLSRTQIPPGGWKFYQPQTGWSIPNPVSVTFNQAVQAIIKHRLANPAVVTKHKLSTDATSVGDELDSYTRARLGIPAAPLPKQMPRLPLLSRVAGDVADIKRAAEGTAVVLDWLSSGGNPVEKDLAEKRASICVNCQFNQEGSWYTVAPAELIKSTLESRKDLNLKTNYDEGLKSCHVCKCLMRLKVWTPLSFILAKTKSEILAEFPVHCWIKTKDQ